MNIRNTKSLIAANERPLRRRAATIVSLGLAAALAAAPLAVLPAAADEAVVAAPVSEVDAAAPVAPAAPVEAPAAEPAPEAAPAPAPAAAEPAPAPAEPAAAEPAAAEPATENAPADSTPATPAAPSTPAKEADAPTKIAAQKSGSATSAAKTKRVAAFAAAADPRAVGLVATSSPQGISVTWTAPQDFGPNGPWAYAIDTSVAGSGAWTQAVNVYYLYANSTYNIGGLTLGQAYDVRIRANNGSYVGPWTTVTGVIAGVLPSVPQQVTATPGVRSLAVAWAAPSSSGTSPVYVYEVRYRGSALVVWSSGGATTTTSAVISNLPADAPYEVQVRARNNSGFGPWSASATARTLATPPAVTNLSASSADEAINLSWTEPADTGTPIDSYTVEYRVIGDDENPWLEHNSGISTTATIEGLTNGTTYEFRVYATSSQGVGDTSATVTGVPVGKPSAITNATWSPTDTGAILDWDEPTDNGGAAIDHYLVTWEIGETQVSWVETSGITLSNLPIGVPVSVRVFAVNDGGFSGPEVTIDSVVAGIVPGQATSLYLFSHSTTLDASWTAPSFAGASSIGGYDVRWRPAGRIEVLAFEDNWSYSVAESTSTTITGLTNSVLYEVQVRARNTGGEGPWSETASATPFSFAPTFTLRDGSSIAGTALEANDVIVVAGSGSLPGETVRVELSSGAIALGSTVVAEDGTFSVEVAIPASAKAGKNAIYAYMAGGGFLIADAEVAITIAAAVPADEGDDGDESGVEPGVAPAAAPAATDGSLAVTGVDEGQLIGGALAALLLLAAGSALVVARRRSPKAE